jgi:hypothetical protein
VEEVDGAPPRREGRRRDEGAEHRILVVLAHRHHPRIDAVPAHDRRQHGRQPLGQPPLLARGLVAQRA